KRCQATPLQGQPAVTQIPRIRGREIIDGELNFQVKDLRSALQRLEEADDPLPPRAWGMRL
ncbi:MAG: hypothetical protein ACUVSB_07780, partial [Anaerolineae bacterium]